MLRNLVYISSLFLCTSFSNLIVNLILEIQNFNTVVLEIQNTKLIFSNLFVIVNLGYKIFKYFKFRILRITITNRFEKLVLRNKLEIFIKFLNNYEYKLILKNHE